MDLSRREADIAIRVLPAGEKPADYLIGRYLSPITASAFVHRDLLNPDNPEDVSHLEWIGKAPEGEKEEWLTTTPFPQLPVRHSISNINLLVGAVNARMGMAWMPCFSVYYDPDIVEVPGTKVFHHSDLWVLTHKDLRLTARLRALREVIAAEFARISHQLDTRQHPHAPAT
jgi:DNA-binding transcriptional LysR family regulator